MQTINRVRLTDTGTAAVISGVLVLPFVVLEWTNRQAFQEGFPIPLFAAMWLLSAFAVVLLLPVVRVRRTQSPRGANYVRLLSRLVVAILLAWLWVALVRDQMPCFLGVPNCD